MIHGDSILILWSNKTFDKISKHLNTGKYYIHSFLLLFVISLEKKKNEIYRLTHCHDSDMFQLYVKKTEEQS
jgi:hypothetical protein